MRELVQEQKVARVDLRMERITVIVPFKAFNSKYTGESEELRHRAWHLSVSQLRLHQLGAKKLEDLYQKFSVSVGSIGLRLEKPVGKDPTTLMRTDVIEEFQVNVLIEVKSKLKARYLTERLMLMIEEGKNEVALAKRLPVNQPECKVTIGQGESAPTVLNLTPDSYNALVLIADALAPECLDEMQRRQ